MKVVLQKDVKNVGKVGDVVSVKNGFARNFLLPRSLAVSATETSVKAWEHIKAIATAKKKKALVERKELLGKMSRVTVTLKMVAGTADKLFGSVTAHDISQELEKQGFSVDRRDIHIEPIKTLGQHKATIRLGEGLEVDSVETYDACLGRHPEEFRFLIPLQSLDAVGRKPVVGGVLLYVGTGDRLGISGGARQDEAGGIKQESQHAYFAATSYSFPFNN